MLGIDGVQSRIAALQGLIAGTSPSPSSTDFATALAEAEETSAPSGTSGDSPSSLLGTSTTSSTSDGTSGLLSSLLGTSSSTSSLSALLGSLRDTSSGTTSQVTAQDLVSSAEKYLGTPYVWGGDSLSDGGLDCSGLVVRALGDLGVTDVPRTAAAQQSYGTAVDSLADAKAGDLLIFRDGKHVGIYLGDDRMIESPAPGGQVRETTLYETPTSIRRVLPTATDSTSTGSASPATGAVTSTAVSQAAAQRLLLSLLGAR